jgi:hypothetical protein
MAFRLVDCKKFGIVKGVEKLVAIEGKDLFIPLAQYEEKTLTLKAGTTKKIDISTVASFIDQSETYSFDVNIASRPNIFANGTRHKYTLFDEDLNALGSFQFEIGTDYDTFYDAVIAEAQANNAIKEAVTFSASDADQTGTFSISANAVGIKYRHLWEFQLNIAYLPYFQTLQHPGNLTSKYQKYPAGRVKMMMIYALYDKAKTSSGCNCTDSSGDLMSNKKSFQWAFDSEYSRKVFPTTPITTTLNTYPSPSFQWNQSSTDHIGYYFSVNDGVTLSSGTGNVSVITSMNGFTVNVGGNVGGGTGLQDLQKVSLPNTVQWKNGGDFLFFSGAQDVLPNDMLYVESVWLKNPQNYDIPFKILIGS